MATRDTRVTAYIRARAPFARPILEHLRGVIHAGDARLHEDIKWGMPTFMLGERIVCGFAGFKAHCALWFWKGDDIVGGKRGGAMGSFGRIVRLEDLPTAARLKRYVAAAVRRLETVGVRPARTPKRTTAKRAPTRGRRTAKRANPRGDARPGARTR